MPPRWIWVAVPITFVFILGLSGIASTIRWIRTSPPKKYLVIDNKSTRRWLLTKESPAVGSTVVYFHDDKGNYWHLINGEYTVVEFKGDINELDLQ